MCQTLCQTFLLKQNVNSCHKENSMTRKGLMLTFLKMFILLKIKQAWVQNLFCDNTDISRFSTCSEHLSFY